MPKVRLAKCTQGALTCGALVAAGGDLQRVRLQSLDRKITLDEFLGDK